MAIPADQLVPGGSGGAMGEVNLLRTEFNKLVDAMRVLTAKLDADAGITDTNYDALVTAAGSASPSKVMTVWHGT